jgi:regulator of cell morphogenesis and NO signaling
VRNPIEHMLADHNVAGDSLARISTLSNGYKMPPDGCPTFRSLYQGLAEFEQNLHRHVHLENNILFPRALEMEKAGK